MYLSRIMLNVKQRDTMRALASPQLLHGAVEQSYDGDRQRNLWRIDWLGENCYLLVLSVEKPDFLRVAEQFGFSDSERQWETKDYSSLLLRLQTGQIWRFRLSANPVHSSFKEKDETSGRGKVFAHVTPEQQKQWLLVRSEACGFTLEENAFDVVYSQWKKFQKGKDGNREVSLNMVSFEGVLKISDVERFKHTLHSGIGRAKAYGCGLLTITRYKGSRNE